MRMKKLLSFVLIIMINFMTTVPALSGTNETWDNDQTVLSTSIEDETVYLSPKNTYVLETESDIDVNEAKVDDEIYFILVSKEKLLTEWFYRSIQDFWVNLKKLKKVNLCLKEQRHIF